ncbi:MAG: peptidylprolyl isomerase [Alphaproteobacteria bacterium]|nr:peptidylprolyl isomerase [Alphaproteobacteria bacterium]
MRQSLHAALLMTALSAVPAFAQAPAPASPAAPAAAAPAADDPVVARVNGLVVNRSEIDAMRQNLPAQYQQVPFEVLFPIMLERIIDMKLIAAAGRVDRLQEDAEVRRRVAQYEDRVIQEIYLTRAIATAVSDDAVRARVERLQRETPAVQQLRARHILVQNEAQAREVIGELQRGGDFAAIARARSMDPGGRQDGGDLGWFGEGDMVPEFYAAAARIADGQVGADPVRTQFGWHVIKVEGRRSQAPQGDNLRDRVVSDLTQEAIDGLVQRLRQGAAIERFGPDGSARPAGPVLLPQQPAAPATPSGPARTPR